MALLIFAFLFCAIGFSIWIGVQKLYAIYEERTPQAVQENFYWLTKNLPQLVFDGVFSLVFWSGLGAAALRIVLLPFGADRFLPDVSWASSVVIGVIVLFVMSFWSTPERSKAPPPRGRDLKKGAGKPLQEKTKTPSRGRTIRSYQDIR
jgi:hypothetical protein